MNKKQMKTKKSQEKIIHAAIELFGEKGYDQFSVTSLCNTYHISKGLFYHNFSGKEELFLHCVTVCYDQLLRFLNRDGRIPSIERYIELRLAFFKEHPHLARIFFESFIQTTSSIFEKVQTIRNTLMEFNRQVYEQFLKTVELRPTISHQDALDYFEMAQKMFNSYYSSPAFRSDDIDFLAEEHRRNLSLFIECIIWGVANKE